jgi:hypothetical protein
VLYHIELVCIFVPSQTCYTGSRKPPLMFGLVCACGTGKLYTENRHTISIMCSLLKSFKINMRVIVADRLFLCPLTLTSGLSS